MVYFVFGKLLYPLWHFLLFWTNCHCCKWPYVHWIIIIKPSGHTVGNGREISQLLDRSTRERVFEFLSFWVFAQHVLNAVRRKIIFNFTIFAPNFRRWLQMNQPGGRCSDARISLNFALSPLSLSLFTSSFCLRTWAKGKVITWVVLVLWAIL